MTPELIPRTRLVWAPGAVHIPDWLSIVEQRHLLAACNEWAKPPAPMRAARMPNGGIMSVKTVCLGWQWIPYRYSRIAEDTDGAPVDPFPDWLVEVGRRAVADAFDDRQSGAAYAPDAALVNYYDAQARLGLHKDQDEHASAPVVSLSLGDSAIFRFGNPDNRGRPYADVEVRSGDAVVFGGPSRYAYHGVTKILPGTSHPDIGRVEGRWNITLRVTGLSG